jgi:hypothetical protein
MGDRGAVRTREGEAKSLRSVFHACFIQYTCVVFYCTPCQKHKPHDRFEECSSSKQADSFLLRGGAGAGDIQERDI